MMNEAMMVAREQAAREEAIKRRQEAFAELQAAMQGGGAFGRVVSTGSAATLQAAIDAARDAGVSDQEVEKAERKLAQIKGQ